jgi:RNA polymerase sigma factor (sigma-70 family)
MCSRNPQLTEEAIHRLFATARRLAALWGPPGDVDDVAQEAVVRLLRQPVLPGNPGAWLYVVTRRIANRARLRTLARLTAESLYERDVRGTRDPDLFMDIHSILERLPPRDRRLLLLVVEGVGSADIAREFGVQVRDVGQMVSRARRKARKLMDARDGKRD